MLISLDFSTTVKRAPRHGVGGEGGPAHERGAGNANVTRRREILRPRLAVTFSGHDRLDEVRRQGPQQQVGGFNDHVVILTSP